MPSPARTNHAPHSFPTRRSSDLLKLQMEASVRSAVRRSATENVLGRWSGRGPLAREAVLIGGHYDHFGIGAPVNGDSIYNGAEDKDRKSTRLNSSHMSISYAIPCPHQPRPPLFPYTTLFRSAQAPDGGLSPERRPALRHRERAGPVVGTRAPGS